MFKPLFKRIFVLVALTFTFTAWGSLPEDFELEVETTRDLSKECVPTLNHWLKILDVLLKRSEEKKEQSKYSFKASVRDNNRTHLEETIKS